MGISKKQLDYKLQNLMNMVDEMEVRWNFRHADMRLENKYMLDERKEEIS